MNEERALWMINKKNNIMKITNKNTKLKVRPSNIQMKSLFQNTENFCYTAKSPSFKAIKEPAKLFCKISA